MVTESTAMTVPRPSQRRSDRCGRIGMNGGQCSDCDHHGDIVVLRGDRPNLDRSSYRIKHTRA